MSDENKDENAQPDAATTPVQIQRASPQTCSFFVLSLLSTIAFVNGTYAFYTCDYLSRRVVLKDGSAPETICSNYVNGTAQCNLLAQDIGMGFFGFEGTIPVNQRVCFGFTQFISGVGYVTLDLGVAWNAAYWCSVVSNIFGFVAFWTCLMASCCPLSKSRMAGLSCYYLFACLFQGLTFLMFNSSVCDEGFFSAFFQAYPIMSDAIEGVTCELSYGSKCAISSTVLYFLCVLVAPGVTPPLPLGMSYWDEEELNQSLRRRDVLDKQQREQTSA